MDVQQIFYIVGIIFMVVGLLLLLGIAILVFYIRKKIDDVHDSIEKSIKSLTAASVKPIQKAVDMARSVLPPPKKRTKKRR